MQKSFGRSIASLTVLAALFAASHASAHVSVQGPAFAGATQVVQFSIGHGCDGADTVGLKVLLPEGLTSVRPLPGSFGDATIEKNAAGDAVSVTWSKPEARAGDDQYYQFAVRMALPETPFRTLVFPATQRCRTTGGVETTVEWAAVGASHEHGGDAAAPAPVDQPAPTLFLMPARSPGWNKYTADAHLHDLSIWSDASIVWVGNAAYSPNPATVELIRAEPDVEELSEIHPGSEIWVKY